MNILALSRWFPYPPANGSKLRIYNLLRELAQSHQLSLISFTDHSVLSEEVDWLHSLCAEVVAVPWKPIAANTWRGRLGYLSRKPRSVTNAYSPIMARNIDQLLAQTHFDVVIAFQFDMASYYPHFDHIPTMLEELQVGELYDLFAHAPTFGLRIRYGLMWYKHCAYLRSVLKHCQVCTVVSEQEQKLAAHAAPAFHDFEIIPNFVNLQDYADETGPAQPDTLIYTGALSYGPNYQAMCWFLRDIYPAIQQQVPEVQFTITGHHANLPLPVANNVNFTGYVDDIHPHIARSWISVVPLQSGGGTRLKILEAMALGTPVVSTSKGAEGLSVRHGEHLLLADSAEEFQRAVVRLLRDPALRQQLATNARQLIQTHYERAVVMPHFLNLVNNIGQKQIATYH